MLQASQKHLLEKFKMQNSRDLYKYFMVNGKYFNRQTLALESPIEQLYKLVFIGSHYERRNCGNSPRDYIIACIEQYKQNMIELDLESISQILISLGNTLIKDDELIENLLSQIMKQNINEQWPLKLSLSIYHSLYKLMIDNPLLVNKLEHEFYSGRDLFTISDYMAYLYILSNKYVMGTSDEKTLVAQIEQLKKKQDHINKHSYHQKTSFQYCQFMFNLFPEIIPQKLCDAEPRSDNKFRDYFDAFYREFMISKMIVDRRMEGKQIEYYENSMYPNVIKQKEDFLLREVTNFELNISELLESLNIEFKHRKLVSIYEIDFVTKDNILINCNGQNHFVEDVKGNVVGKQPNFIMQQRHLYNYGVKKIIDIDYHLWMRIDPRERQLAALQSYLDD